MSGSTETHLDPDEVVSAAAGLAVTSDEVREAVAAAAARIRTAHESQPWGQDSAGDAFRRGYLGEGGDGGGGVEAILDGADTVCGQTYDIATRTGVGAIESQLRDEESAARISRLTAELRAQDLSSSLLADQGTVRRINELHAMMQDPRVADYLGQEQAAEVAGFLDQFERLAE